MVIKSVILGLNNAILKQRNILMHILENLVSDEITVFSQFSFLPVENIFFYFKE